MLNYPPCLCLLPRFLPDHLFRIHESKNVETVNYYYCSSINDRNHKSLPTNFSYKFNDFLSCNDFVSIYTSSSRLFIDQSIKSNIEPSQNQNGWRNGLAASIRSPYFISAIINRDKFGNLEWNVCFSSCVFEYFQIRQIFCLSRFP